MMEVWRILLIACFVSHIHAVESCPDMCTRCSSESTVELSCPDAQVIRVLEKVIIIDCTGEDICSPTSCCGYRPPSSELRPVCNGRQLCNETVSELQDTLFSDGSQPQYYQVSYKCVSLSLTTNMCGNDYVDSREFHLVTPDFPGLTSPASRPLCRCRVQGESITVTAVQIDLPFNGSSLNLSDVTDNRMLWSSVQGWSAPLYNTVLYTGKGLQTFDIAFSEAADEHQTVWIEVKANTGTAKSGSGVRTNLITPPPVSMNSVVSMSSTSSPVSESTSDVPSGKIFGVCKAGIDSSSPTISATESACPTSTSCEMPVSVVVLSVLCGLLAVALVVSNLYHLRGRLCRARDPTYARTEAPVAEDTRPYTELRIYENHASEQEQSAGSAP